MQNLKEIINNLNTASIQASNFNLYNLYQEDQQMANMPAKMQNFATTRGMVMLPDEDTEENRAYNLFLSLAQVRDNYELQTMVLFLKNKKISRPQQNIEFSNILAGPSKIGKTCTMVANQVFVFYDFFNSLSENQKENYSYSQIVDGYYGYSIFYISGYRLNMALDTISSTNFSITSERRLEARRLIEEMKSAGVVMIDDLVLFNGADEDRMIANNILVGLTDIFDFFRINSQKELHITTNISYEQLQIETSLIEPRLINRINDTCKIFNILEKMY
jgi:hypothetical protein